MFRVLSHRTGVLNCLAIPYPPGLDKFPDRSWLRGGVYFVESLAKTHNGKVVKREVTQLAQKLFERALKTNDEMVLASLSVIPDEYRRLINERYDAKSSTEL